MKYVVHYERTDGTLTSVCTVYDELLSVVTTLIDRHFVITKIERVIPS